MFEDLSAHLAYQVEETVCAVIVSRNSCNIKGVSRMDQPIADLTRARFDPIPGRQPIMEIGVFPADRSARGTVGQVMIDTGASFSMVTQAFAQTHNLEISPGLGSFAQADCGATSGQIIGHVSMAI